jgi:CMP-N-acetylneuraminic acid synthetase
MKIIALLPMKANSQRVPGKNFRDFSGKPLFAWILDTLLSIEAIDEVVIDTDARAELEARGLKGSERVRLQQRPDNLCGDTVSMNHILAHDIKTNSADIYIMTHTTNPFLSAATISDGIQKYQAALKLGHDSLFSVDPMRMRFYRSDMSPVNHDPDNLIQTQDLEVWFAENSNLYIFSSESFERTQARIGKKPILMPTPKFESVDIDTPEDWDFAEAIAHARQTGRV